MLYVLTERSCLYRINCETRAYKKIQDSDEQMEDEDEVRSQIQTISGGTDFITLLKSDGHLLATGKNDKGQLGLNHFKTEEEFKCIEDLSGANISRVFAGSRSCFAVAKSNTATTLFIDELKMANKDRSTEKTVNARKFVLVQTSD